MSAAISGGERRHRREIALALGVPPMLLGIPGDNTYSDDPYDPGGPTNHGITLRVFAKWRGVDLDAASTPALKAELKRISPDVVKAIYFERYWRPAQCTVLNAPLALMHFDASVNHGVAGAARLLQRALGVAVDGEIGPETIGAAKSQNGLRVIERYADQRRARYRALPHFWRFGRGWLRRVDVTLRVARALGGAGPVTTQTTERNQQTGETSMNGETDVAVKWWGHSVTIWGAIVSALAAVLPVLGPLTGIDISGDLVRLAGEQIAVSAQAVMALIGTLMTIFGRLRATDRLIRRDLNIRL